MSYKGYMLVTTHLISFVNSYSEWFEAALQTESGELEKMVRIRGSPPSYVNVRPRPKDIFCRPLQILSHP